MMKHQDCYCYKIYRGRFTKICGGLYGWGTERVLFINCNKEGDKISLGYCGLLLINLRDVAK